MKTKVYGFCNSGDRTDLQMWMAMAEDGEVIAQHCSSSRYWGEVDVSPNHFHIDDYQRKFGDDFKPDDVEYVVLPAGEGPPAEVVEANRLLGIAAKAGEEASASA